MRWGLHLLYHSLLSLAPRLGRMRGLIVINLRMVGGGLLTIATPFFWWLDRQDVRWWGCLGMGSGFLAAAAFLRWSAVWAPAGPGAGGSE